MKREIKKLKKERNKGYKRGTPIYAENLLKEGIAKQQLAYIGVEPKKNLNNALILLNNSQKQGLRKGTSLYGISLVIESIVRQLLAKEGIDTKNNLSKSLKLLKKARNEGLIKNSYEYGNTFMEEGTTRALLADEGIDIKENYEVAINLFEKSRISGLSIGTDSYAVSLMNEGYAKIHQANIGLNPIENSKSALKLILEAKKYFKKGSYHYASILMKEGEVRTKLGVLRINPIENLNKSIELSNTSRKEGLIKGSNQYAQSLSNEALAIAELIGFEDVGSKIDYLTYSKDLFKKSRNEGFVEGTPSYGASLLNEGESRVKIAELGINPLKELFIAIKLFKKARNDNLIPGTYEYSLSLINEGNALSRCTEIQLIGPKTILRLNRAIFNYEEARQTGLYYDSIEYTFSLINEAAVRLKLAELGLEVEENVKKCIEFNKIGRKNIRENNLTSELNLANTYVNEASARYILADLDIDSKNNEEKAKSLNLKALKRFSKENNITGLISVYTNIGNHTYKNKDYNNAYQNLNKAINLIEDMRGSIKIPEIRKQYFESVIKIFELMVFTCVALGKNKEALKYVELSKGRNLLELLGNKKIKLESNLKDINDLRKVVSLIENIGYEIFVKSKTLSLDESDEIDKLKDIQNQLKNQYDSLLLKIKSKNPEYYALKTINPIIPENNTFINGKTLIEYFLGKDLVIFILNDDLKVIKVEINIEQVFANFTEFKKTISLLGITEDINERIKLIQKNEEIFRYFYNLLIKPIEKYFNKDIIIIPSKILYHLPFNALKDENNRYLIEKFSITIAQSISSLHFLNSNHGQGSLVIGNPNGDLPHSEDEAITVADILQVNPILREDTKKARIKNEILNKKYVHMACHGSFDSYHPLFSKINLFGGFLTVRDFMNLEINAKLIVLSACESGLCSVNMGDEIEGFVTAIIFSGCKFIISSLWEVDDKSTKELFLEFYNDSGTINERIRNAQLKLIKKYSFYNWAPFVLYGI